jgi:hypothetical protein
MISLCLPAAQVGVSHRAILAALLLGLIGITTSAAPAAAQELRWESQLDVAPPGDASEPYRASLTVTLIGSRPSVVLAKPVQFTYRWDITGPHGQAAPLLDKLPRWSTQPVQITGTVLHLEFAFSPDELGEWVVAAWQLNERGEERKLGERRVVIESTAPGGDSAAGAQLITGLRVVPEQPVVGQPATITIEIANKPIVAIQELPVYLVDCTGVQELATLVTPSAGQSVDLVWVPDRATPEALIQVFDRSLTIVVNDAPSMSTTGAQAEGGSPQASGDGEPPQEWEEVAP